MACHNRPPKCPFKAGGFLSTRIKRNGVQEVTTKQRQIRKTRQVGTRTEGNEEQKLAGSVEIIQLQQGKDSGVVIKTP
jgi:hypothetical protein